MKKIRKITDDERDILLGSSLRSPLPLGTMFYIMGILLPFFTCMVITLDFTYLYIFLVGIVILLFIVVIYPMIYYNHLQTGDIFCFDSTILSCRSSDIYYYMVEIEGLDGEFIDVKYPVKKRAKIGTEVVVVMLFGKNKQNRFLLLDKAKAEMISSKRTRYDLID